MNTFLITICVTMNSGFKKLEEQNKMNKVSTIIHADPCVTPKMKAQVDCALP